jgi:hypothetical protein
MAKSYQAPPGVDIAALRDKKKTTGLDLMRPGEGTPWEDRGALGLVKAFFQTCFKSITSPVLLLDHIRRPDTAHEARQFAFGCSALWAISAIIHGFIIRAIYPPSKELLNWVEDYPTKSAGKIIVLGLVVGVGSYFLLVSMASRMYYALISTELKNAAPRVLVYNIFCYCTGPSILAPIPVIGPVAALVLMFMMWCAAGSKRLYVSWRGAIVAASLSMVGVLVIVGVGLFLADMVLNNVFGLHEPTPEELGQVGGSGSPYGPAKK